jgi:hypothetical protein
MKKPTRELADWAEMSEQEVKCGLVGCGVTILGFISLVAYIFIGLIF